MKTVRHVYMDNAGVPTGTCIHTSHTHTHTHTHTHLMDWNRVSPAYSPCLVVQRQPGHQHEGTPHADATRSAGQTALSLVRRWNFHAEI